MSLARELHVGCLVPRQALDVEASINRSRSVSNLTSLPVRAACNSLQGERRRSNSRSLANRTCCWGFLTNRRQKHNRMDVPTLAGGNDAINAGKKIVGVTQRAPAIRARLTESTESGRNTLASLLHRLPRQDFAALPSGRVVLPSVLWGMLGLLWLVSTRASVGDQCVAFLIAEVLYSGLHVKPLLPLLQSDPQSDEAFISTFTTPLYFAGELALLWLLGTASPIRDVLPSTVFGLHAAFHVLFTLLSGVAPVWAIEQNNSRIQNGWKIQTPGGAWAVLLNLLNFTDFSLHAAYTACFCVALLQGTSPESQTLMAGTPIGSLLAGALMYSVIGEVLPDKLHSQAPSTAAEVPARDLHLNGSMLQRAPTTSPKLREKTVLVTGGSSGIGQELARMLYQQGARVIITSPSYERATEARNDLMAVRNPSYDVIRSDHDGVIEAMQLDLSCPQSIARFAESVRAKYKRLDIVVHNAATSHWWPYRETNEGIEVNMAVNHLGPFRLTQLLLPLITRASESHGQRSRVVVVASSAYKLFTTSAGLNLTALSGATAAQESYTPWRAYGESKLANILFARELSRRFGRTAFVVVAIDPGNTMSGLQRNMGLLGVLLNGATKTLGGSPVKAASNVFRAACSEAYTGRNFVFVEEEREAELKERGRNDAQARELWKISEALSEKLRSLQKI